MRQFLAGDSRAEQVTRFRKEISQLTHAHPLGKEGAALQACAVALAVICGPEFPDSAWAYIGWGDMYKDLGDYDQAESICRLALERNVADREYVLERLRDLEEERESARRE